MSIQDPVSGGLRRAAAVLAAIVLAAATTHAAEPPVLPEAEPAIVKQLTAPTRSKSRVRNVPLPHRKVAPPGAGNTTAYGTDVDRDFGAALAAFFAGDGEAALAALDAAEAARANKNYRWEIAFLRAQTLIMMGRAADAEDQLAETARREIAAMGRSANTRALRGEARLWLDDFDGAIADYAQVTHDLRNWRMPTDFREIPSDIPTMVAKTTAQIRALSGLATVHLLKGDVVAALAWAKEAEARFNDVHYVVNHNLYGQFIAVHADSYNGRAQNLMFLAAAQTITAGDAAAGEPIFAAARKYFEAIGFAAGTVTVDAVRAWSLKEIGAFDEAARLAEVTVKQAAALGLADTIWRVEAVRGEALLANNQPGPAEQAFRNAQAAINAISGALATDRAKRRFGVGKDDITYRFVGFDLARGDLAALVSDIERGRARAFIDMLAGRAVASGRQPELVAEIRALDTAILKGRVARLAPSGARPPTNEAALFARRAAALAKLRQIDAELADVFAVSTRSLADVRAALAPGEVMAYTIPGRGNDRVRLLLIRNADATLVDADISVDELGAAIRGFVEAVTDGDAGEQTAIAALLGNQLGIADWGASGTLYVVPSGDINFVPWGALALDVPVVILPTGGWLGRASGNTAAAARAAAVGDPDFFGALPQLPGARAEAAEVAGFYGTNPLLGRAASEPGLRAHIGGGVNVLHLATHGVFDAADPLASRIYLSGADGPRALTAAALFERPLPAKIVVLSACETGAGTAVAGDDFLGLPRSFYFGGALAVVSSLWRVDDAGTRAFMNTFHRTLATSGDLGAAWLAARNAAKAAGRPPSVYGAFVLGGAARLR